MESVDGSDKKLGDDETKLGVLPCTIIDVMVDNDDDLSDSKLLSLWIVEVFDIILGNDEVVTLRKIFLVSVVFVMLGDYDVGLLVVSLVLPLLAIIGNADDTTVCV